MNPEVHNYLAMYQTTQAYLKLPTAYCAYLGGIRWSSDDDALVYPDGRCFAYCEPIAAFLEGFAGAGRVMPFGCVLHWIDLLVQNGRKHLDPAARRLRQVFHETGSKWRNAGALAAAVTDGVPEPAVAPELEHVCRRLRDQSFPIRWFIARFQESPLGPAEVPAIAPEYFERLVVGRLTAYSDADLRAWLRDGRGPLHDAGAQLVREPPRPRTLTGVLAALLLRPRLAGAETHVTRLVGALTLPPRRLAPQELPVGGYADMTTRGEVEHLLPSQHALDELEFVRRFAERELLFFRREEPPAQNQQELAVVLDQGVRTWGDVRLVLAAAVLALGKQAVQRGQQFRLGATSNGGRLLDPVAADDATLGELIEASDLSFHPGSALETLLEQPSAALRDVVLLTHPRNLREADVLVAARRAGPRDRLFAVTIDEAGAAAVSEIRHGALVPLRQFRVGYEASQPPAAATDARTALAPWTGDIEPVPLPFRFGTHGRIAHFEFDHQGNWLLTVSGDGMLHLWSLRDDHREVLPRPRSSDGTPAPWKEMINGIISVSGGFILLAVERGLQLAAHYDVARRRCRGWALGAYSRRGPSTVYVPEQHMLLIATGDGREVDEFSLDLATGELQRRRDVLPPSRAAAAWAGPAWKRPPVRCDAVPWHAGHKLTFAPAPAAICWYRVDGNSGMVTFRQLGYEDYTFTPLADGKPILKDGAFAAAQAAGEVLALLVRVADGTLRLLLLRGPTGQLITERRYDPRLNESRRFLLSPDGRWLARDWGSRLIVEKIDEPGAQMTTRCGGYNPEGQLLLGERCLLLSFGQKHWHLVRWSVTTVDFHYEKREPTGSAVFQDAAFQEALRQAPLAVARTASAAPPPSYDPGRFVAAADHGSLRFTLDCFGQVAVFDQAGVLLCMFMAFRDRLAAWLPDGSYCGSPALALKPETPGTRARLARILHTGEEKKT